MTDSLEDVYEARLMRLYREETETPVEQSAFAIALQRVFFVALRDADGGLKEAREKLKSLFVTGAPHGNDVSDGPDGRHEDDVGQAERQ